MSGPKMTTTVQFRMRRADKRTLARLAKHYERTPSEVLRRLISDEAARLATILNVTAKKEIEHGSEESK
jgi:hypothetical protein